MITGDVKYGISILPTDCKAYADGFRFGAYRQDLPTGESHVTEFFRTSKEIQDFVNKNLEYGKEREI